MTNPIAVIGLGRFGSLLSKILSKQFQVIGFDLKDSLASLKPCDTVFICVPIRNFEHVIKGIVPYLKPSATVIDTCSVKCHPVKIMQRLLPSNITQIATHPLFGPDSYENESIHRIMTHYIQGDKDTYDQWVDIFKTLGLTTIEMTPEQHDKDAAYSQGITHCLGRALNQMQVESTPIDTLGFERLLGIKDQTCHDTSTLFEDLIHFNPYSQAMLKLLQASVNNVLSPLQKTK